MPKGVGYPDGKGEKGSVAEKGSKMLKGGQSKSDSKDGFMKSVVKKDHKKK